MAEHQEERPEILREEGILELLDLIQAQGEEWQPDSWPNWETELTCDRTAADGTRYRYYTDSRWLELDIGDPSELPSLKHVQGGWMATPLLAVERHPAGETLRNPNRVAIYARFDPSLVYTAGGRVHIMTLFGPHYRSGRDVGSSGLKILEGALDCLAPVVVSVEGEESSD